MEFSKKLSAWILIVYAVFVFTCLGCIVFKGSQVESILGIVTPIPFAVIGFYYSKAKGENLVKLQNTTTSSPLSQTTQDIINNINKQV